MGPMLYRSKKDGVKKSSSSSVGAKKVGCRVVKQVILSESETEDGSKANESDEESVGSRSSVRIANRSSSSKGIGFLGGNSSARERLSPIPEVTSPPSKSGKSNRVRESPTQRDSQNLMNDDEEFEDDFLMPDTPMVDSQDDIFRGIDDEEGLDLDFTEGVNENALNESTMSSMPAEEQETADSEYSEGGENWNSPSPFVWDPNEKHTVFPLEVQGIYKTLLIDGAKTSRKKSLQNSFVNMCFVMVACLTMDGITTETERMKKEPLWTLSESRFQSCFKNIKLKAYEQEFFFNLLKTDLLDATHTRSWPECVTEFVEDLYKIHTHDGKNSAGLTWGNKELKHLKGPEHDEAKVKCFVGFKVHSAWIHAKGQITMHCARQWIPPHKIHSGYTEEYVFRAIRKTLWKMEAYKRAKNTMKQARATGRKAAGTAEDVVDLDLEESEVEKRARQVLAGMTFEWYPDYWLAFVMYSLPANDKCLLSMNGGMPGIAELNPLASASQAAKSFKRGARQVVSSPGGSILPTPLTGTTMLSPNAEMKAKGKEKKMMSRKMRSNERALEVLDKSELSSVTAVKDVIEHKVVVSGAVTDVMREKIAAQKELIAVYNRRGMTEEADTAELQLLTMLREFVEFSSD